jgi:hypothetical protein
MVGVLYLTKPIFFLIFFPILSFQRSDQVSRLLWPKVKSSEVTQIPQSSICRSGRRLTQYENIAFKSLCDIHYNKQGNSKAIPVTGRKGT